MVLNAFSLSLKFAFQQHKQFSTVTRFASINNNRFPLICNLQSIFKKSTTQLPIIVEAKHYYTLSSLSKLMGKQKSLTGQSQMSSLNPLKTIKSSSSLGSGISLLKMKIIPIRALQDNYMYLLIDEATNKAACIDPVNASAIASYAHDQGTDLKICLTTHHHHDHAGGNAELKSMYPEIDIYGGDNRILALTRFVSQGEIIRLGSLTIECLSTPCHTKGHICYYVTSQEDEASGIESVVFTGDTLFIGGCGRFFEGTPEQMDYALNTVLANLPPDTKVFCGHEYTVTNLKFALSVEPQNADIKGKLAWAQATVAKRDPTVPSSIGEEKKINPFMRIRKSAVRKYTNETEDSEVMAALRQRKNDFQL